MIQATVKTLWGWRKSEDGPELLVAWDEYTVDQNLEGWNEACERAIASCGSDLDEHRYINLVVDYEKIMEAFQPEEVEADVHQSTGI